MTTSHFTWAYASVLVAVLLPIVCAGLAKREGFGRSRREGGYDNHEPRAWLARQTGASARANAAQANTFEALPFFIGAVIVAHQSGAAQGLVDALAVSFVILRVIYIWMYVSDRATLRSLVWMVALAVNIALFVLGWF